MSKRTHFQLLTMSTSLCVLAFIACAFSSQALADTTIVEAVETNNPPSIAVLNKFNPVIEDLAAFPSGHYEIVDCKIFTTDSRAARMHQYFSRMILRYEIEIDEAKSLRQLDKIRRLQKGLIAIKKIVRKWERDSRKKLAVYRLWDGSKFCAMEARESARDKIASFQPGQFVLVKTSSGHMHQSYISNLSQASGEGRRGSGSSGGYASSYFRKSYGYVRALDVSTSNRPHTWTDAPETPSEWNSWIDTRSCPRDIDITSSQSGHQWKLEIDRHKRCWVELYQADGNGNPGRLIETLAIESSSPGWVSRSGDSSSRGTSRWNYVYLTDSPTRKSYIARLVGIETSSPPPSGHVISYDKSTEQSQEDASEESRTVSSSIEDDSENTQEVNVAHQINLAKNLIKSGKRRQAIQTLKMITSNSSATTTSSDLYAICGLFKECNDKDQAIATAKKLIESYPDSSHAKIVKRLYSL